MARPTAQKPTDVARTLSLIAEELEPVRLQGIEDDYRWAYHALYDRHVGDSAPVRTSASDPVLNLMENEGKQSRRDQLGAAAKKLESALNLVREAFNEIRSAIPDPRPSATPLGPDRMPPMITRAEHQASVAAQSRRRVAGEGFGES